ncbi:hypothetical protein KC874_01445 [Candidatus Saccharibacteria bacterium]|jgi:hypothetical protein|nr:hypothetical protein [Candidatus Saccharibacteria bacterium]
MDTKTHNLNAFAAETLEPYAPKRSLNTFSKSFAPYDIRTAMNEVLEPPISSEEKLHKLYGQFVELGQGISSHLEKVKIHGINIPKHSL